jgi:hypothetical protein
MQDDMKLSSKEMLYASLVGSKIAETIPRLSMVQNEAMKHPLPKIPFLPFRNQTEIKTVESVDSDTWAANSPNIENQFFPLSIRRAGSKDPWYTLPYEPLISINAANNIIKRNIAKAPNFIGTVKEHFSQDDYEITITGVFYGEKEIGAMDECFPREDFEALKRYCTAPEGLDVECELLQLLGINQIVVESFSFPFSKGENVQAYDIKALSDYSSEFLLEIRE